jgi:6-phosphofructo-2-kinase
MTRSRASPDGRIADRDVAAKLVIIMVGLPARGKSYITKKIQRYLAWQQHNTRIFNVGNRRRLVAGVATGPNSPAVPHAAKTDSWTQAAAPVLPNGADAPGAAADEPTALDLNVAAPGKKCQGQIDQDATFFDPKNESASKLREQLAMETLEELLDYLICQNGSVGILDATNSTMHRRQVLVRRIREREPKLGVLLIESICHDKDVSCWFCGPRRSGLPADVVVRL